MGMHVAGDVCTELGLPVAKLPRLYTKERRLAPGRRRELADGDPSSASPDRRSAFFERAPPAPMLL